MNEKYSWTIYNPNVKFTVMHPEDYKTNAYYSYDDNLLKVYTNSWYNINSKFLKKQLNPNIKIL